MKTLLPLLLACCLALLAACATSSKAGGKRYCGGEGKDDDAEEHFLKGMDAYHDEAYQEAIKSFLYVQERFQFSECGPLAELLIADSHFEGGQYSEAIDAYDMFVKMHPTHKLVRYASYRKALAYFNQIPTDFWILLPPTYERDMTPVRKALASAREFLSRFGSAPSSAEGAGRYTETIREIKQKCRLKTAEHHMYVAQYYWKREKYRAVVSRLERILKKYRGLGFDEEALFMLGCSYARLGDNALARQRFEELLKIELPSSRRSEVNVLLKNL